LKITNKFTLFIIGFHIAIGRLLIAINYFKRYNNKKARQFAEP